MPECWAACVFPGAMTSGVIELQCVGLLCGFALASRPTQYWSVGAWMPFDIAIIMVEPASAIMVALLRAVVAFPWSISRRLATGV